MTRALILRSPGTNCDEETALAFRLAGAEAELLHVGALLRKERSLDEFDILAFPGGFSYGDDLGAGTVLANRLRAHLAEDLKAFVASGRLVVGICNGFQVLVRLGLLPGWEGDKVVSLVENRCGKFEDRWVSLRVDTDRCPFLQAPGADTTGGDTPEEDRRLRKGSVFRLPVAHMEGQFVVQSPEVLERLEAGGQIALRYVSGSDDPSETMEFPSNPNGSVGGIAGITNEKGNVLGLMPHPERHLFVAQQPNWTRRRVMEGVSPRDAGDGYSFFENAVRNLTLRGSSSL